MNVDRFYAFWAEWFAQPLEEKMKHLRQSGKGGYYPPGSEAPGYETKADPKEYFHVRLAHFFGQDAVFPPEVYQVFRECEEKASEWLWNHGLGESVDDHCPSSGHVLRVLHYPATPDGNVGQAHCDFDLLTVSVPGTCPGLEVFEPGACPNIEPAEDTNPYKECRCPADGCQGDWEKRETFEVHVGEMLTHYTSMRKSCPDCVEDVCSRCYMHTANGWPVGGIPATPHRVRAPPNTERFKAVFFYLPPNDFELRPGFTAGDYLLGPNGVLRKAGTVNVGKDQ